ncbi:hypothetical protein [Microvirga sp. VF16]|uniref:hypothetical protein n=1 Tax=Microvirga sp. VF16 TaxID=2807101 RepID=UPI00193E5B61|nr:hypothetical protein [Microvirga sp. VF16]QRM33130.1 hypothetical protein JO965_27960 [Microvirga sp. VF16]
MAYKLSRLAPDSYDVLLDGVIVASLISNGDPHNTIWTAELLTDLAPEERPKPFIEIEHAFRRLEEARAWLGDPEIHNAL